MYTVTWDLVGHMVHSAVLKLCKIRQNTKQSDKDSKRKNGVVSFPMLFCDQIFRLNILIYILFYKKTCYISPDHCFFQTESIWPELLAGTVHCFVADFSLLPLELIMNRLHLQVKLSYYVFTYFFAHEIIEEISRSNNSRLYAAIF